MIKVQEMMSTFAKKTIDNENPRIIAITRVAKYTLALAAVATITASFFTPVPLAVGIGIAGLALTFFAIHHFQKRHNKQQLQSNMIRAKLETEMNEAKASKAKAQTQAKAANAAKAKAKNEAHAAKAAKEEAENEAKAANAAKEEAEIAEQVANAAKEEAESAVQVANANIAKAEQQVTKLSANLAAAEKRCQTAQQELDQMRMKAREESEHLQGALANAETQKKALEKNAELAESRLTQLTEQLKQQSSVIADQKNVKPLRKQLSETQTRLKEQQQEVIRLKDELKKLAESQIEPLKRQYQRVQAANEILTEENDALVLANKNLEGELKKMKMTRLANGLAVQMPQSGRSDTPPVTLFTYEALTKVDIYLEEDAIKLQINYLLKAILSLIEIKKGHKVTFNEATMKFEASPAGLFTAMQRSVNGNASIAKTGEYLKAILNAYFQKMNQIPGYSDHPQLLKQLEDFMPNKEAVLAGLANMRLAYSDHKKQKQVDEITDTVTLFFDLTEEYKKALQSTVVRFRPVPQTPPPPPPPPPVASTTAAPQNLSPPQPSAAPSPSLPPPPPPPPPVPAAQNLRPPPPSAAPSAPPPVTGGAQSARPEPIKFTGDDFVAQAKVLKKVSTVSTSKPTEANNTLGGAISKAMSDSVIKKIRDIRRDIAGNDDAGNDDAASDDDSGWQSD